MKNQFDVLVERLMGENEGSPTMPAHKDPHEKELAQKFPSWGDPQSNKLASPVSIKLKQVTKALESMGVVDNPETKRVATQQLSGWLDSFEPTELFVMSPQALARQFSKKFLG